MCAGRWINRITTQRITVRATMLGIEANPTMRLTNASRSTIDLRIMWAASPMKMPVARARSSSSEPPMHLG